MNNVSSISVDIYGAQRAFDALTPQQLRSATRSAFRKSATVVKKSVQQEYRADFPGSILYRDVHSKDFRSGKGAIIDLMYMRNHPKGDRLYKSFVLPMLSKGTIDRYVGWYRKGGGAAVQYSKLGVDDYDTHRASKWYDRKAGKYQIGLSRSNYRGRVKGTDFFGRGVDRSLPNAIGMLNTNIVNAINDKARKVGAS